MTHSHKDAEYFNQRRNSLCRAPQTQRQPKVTNKSYFYPRHMKNKAVFEEASAGEVPGDGIGELHAVSGSLGKARGQEMNHLLIWLQVSFGTDMEVPC